MCLHHTSTEGRTGRTGRRALLLLHCHTPGEQVCLFKQLTDYFVIPALLRQCPQSPSQPNYMHFVSFRLKTPQTNPSSPLHPPQTNLTEASKFCCSWFTPSVPSFLPGIRTRLLCALNFFHCLHWEGGNQANIWTGSSLHLSPEQFALKWSFNIFLKKWNCFEIGSTLTSLLFLQSLLHRITWK